MSETTESTNSSNLPSAGESSHPITSQYIQSMSEGQPPNNSSKSVRAQVSDGMKLIALLHVQVTSFLLNNNASHYLIQSSLF